MVEAYSPDGIVLNDNVFYEDDSSNTDGDYERPIRNSRFAFSDTELQTMTVTELNQRLQFLDDLQRSALKRKRRALKNRFYAKRCRTRRLQIRQELEMTCQHLMRQYEAAMQRIQYLEQEMNRYKKSCNCTPMVNIRPQGTMSTQVLLMASNQSEQMPNYDYGSASLQFQNGNNDALVSNNQFGYQNSGPSDQIGRNDNTSVDEDLAIQMLGDCEDNWFC